MNDPRRPTSTNGPISSRQNAPSREESGPQHVLPSSKVSRVKREWKQMDGRTDGRTDERYRLVYLPRLTRSVTRKRRFTEDKRRSNKNSSSPKKPKVTKPPIEAPGTTRIGPYVHTEPTDVIYNSLLHDPVSFRSTPASSP